MDPITVGLIAGGVSSLAGLGGSFLGNYFNRKNAKDQAALNYDYALRMAQAGPSATVKGLRLANLNPILAATDGAFSTPSMPSTDIKSTDFSQIGKGVSDGIAAFQIANQARTVESNIELNKATALREFTHALNQMRTGGLTGHYAALHSLGVSLGFKSDEISGILKNYGFSPLNQSTPDKPKTTPAEVKSRHAPDDGKYGSPSSIAFDYIKDELRREFSKEPYDVRLQSYNAIKQVSPSLAFILRPILKPSVYKMPNPPRSNSLHNQLRKFHRDDRKRSYDNHSWKVR